MIGRLNVAAIAFALAACAVTVAVADRLFVRPLARALDWIENRRAPQPDEAQLLLAALCEPLKPQHPTCTPSWLWRCGSMVSAGPASLRPRSPQAAKPW